MADVKIGYGAEWWMADETDVLTEMAEVIEIALPNPQTDTVEATHFKSPGRQREYIAGLIDNGEITLSINYIAGSETDLLITAAMTAGDAREQKIVIPSTAGSQDFTFSGIVSGYEKTVPVDDRQTATITLRVNGAVTQAATVTP